MNFLSNEWYEAYIQAAKARFSKSGKLNLSFCEIYENCPDGSTKWIRLEMQNSQIVGAEFGSGEHPTADYVGSGKYPDHILIAQGKIDPKKAVLAGTFKISDNQGGTNALRILKLIEMYMRLVDAKKSLSVEY